MQSDFPFLIEVSSRTFEPVSRAAIDNGIALLTARLKVTAEQLEQLHALRSKLEWPDAK